MILSPSLKENLAMFPSSLQGHSPLLLHIAALRSKVENLWHFIEKPLHGISNTTAHSKELRKCELCLP